MIYPKFFGASLLLLAFFTLPAQAKLYKWVDDRGVTHYGETIPPEYANKNNVQLNEKGRITQRNEKSSAEEKQALQEAESGKRTAESIALEQKRKDMSLLSTYSNEQEIELARTRNLQQIEARIRSTQLMRNTAEANLRNFQREADSKTNSGKKIPVSLQTDLTEAKDRLDSISNDLITAEEKAARLNTLYDADKARYRELTTKFKK